MENTGKTKGNKVIKSILFIIGAGIIVLSIIPYELGFIPENIASILRFEESNFSSGSNISMGVRCLKVILMILCMFVLYDVILVVLKSIKISSKRGNTIKKLFESILNYLVVGFAFLIALALLGVNITALAASVGIIALIIGIGAESLIADIMTGLFMILEGQCSVGDIIEVDGWRGTVSEVGMRTTSITDSDGNVKIFNNSDVRNIINISNYKSRTICDIPVPHEVNIEKATAIINGTMEKLQAAHPEIFEDAPTVLGLQEFNDVAVYLRVNAFVEEAYRFDAARMINWELKIALDKAGMGAPHSSEITYVANEHKEG